MTKALPLPTEASSNTACHNRQQGSRAAGIMAFRIKEAESFCLLGLPSLLSSELGDPHRQSDRAASGVLPGIVRRAAGLCGEMGGAVPSLLAILPGGEGPRRAGDGGHHPCDDAVF